MPQQKLEIEISASDKASQVFREAAANAAASIQKTLNYRSPSQSEGKGVVEQLKSGFGRESGIFEASHIFGGAGPVIGLGVASRELSEFTGKLLEARNSLQDQNLMWTDMAQSIAKSIPLLGGIVESGANIYELLTGEKAAVDQITEATKAQDEFTKAHVENVRALQMEYQRVADSVRKINEETARIGMTGPAASLSQAVDDRKDKQAQLDLAKSGGNPPDLQRDLDGSKQRIDQQIAQQRAEQQKFKDAFESERAQYSALMAVGQRPFAEIHKQSALASARDFAAANNQIKQLQADANKASTAIRDDFIKNLGADIAKSTAAAFEASKQNIENLANPYREAAIRIRQIQAQAQAEGLRNSGQNYQADLVLLKQSLNEQNEAVDESLRKRIHDIEHSNLSPGLADQAKGDAQAQAAQQKAANSAKFDQDAAAAKKAALEQQEQFELRISQIRTQGLMGALDLAGRNGEFERKSLEITDQFAARRREILEMMKQASEEQKNQLILTLQQSNAEEKIAQQLHTQQSLQEMAAAPLKDAAAAGNRIAGLMLKQQEIQKDFSQRAKDLDSIINDSKSTSQQRAEAQSMKGGLGDEQTRAMQRAAAASMPFVSPLAPTEMVQSVGNQGMRGYAAAANEKAYLANRQPLGLSGSETSNFSSTNSGEAALIAALNNLTAAIGRNNDVHSSAQKSDAHAAQPKTRSIFSNR